MRYKKKPVVIEAVQYVGLVDNEHTFSEVPGWLHDGLTKTHPSDGAVYSYKGSLYIMTLEGSHQVSRGDYIIRGVNGELYPCKPDIFAKTYEAA